MSFGGTVAKPGTAPMIWEVDGTTLGVVDAPSPDGEVTTGASGLWPPLGASVNTGRTQRHVPGNCGQGEGEVTNYNHHLGSEAVRDSVSAT